MQFVKVKKRLQIIEFFIKIEALFWNEDFSLKDSGPQYKFPILTTGRKTRDQDQGPIPSS